MSVEDSAHGSLSGTDCAAYAVDFFSSGEATTQTCPVPPPPVPSTNG